MTKNTSQKCLSSVPVDLFELSWHSTQDTDSAFCQESSERDSNRLEQTGATCGLYGADIELALPWDSHLCTLMSQENFAREVGWEPRALITFHGISCKCGDSLTCYGV